MTYLKETLITVLVFAVLAFGMGGWQMWRNMERDEAAYVQGQHDMEFLSLIRAGKIEVSKNGNVFFSPGNYHSHVLATAYNYLNHRIMINKIKSNIHGNVFLSSASRVEDRP